MSTKDHRLEVYVSGTQWLALKRRADRLDCSISHHVRNLIREDLEAAACQEIDEEARRQGGGNSGEGRDG